MSDSPQATRGRKALPQARAGFTLVELVIVALMVAILSGLAVPSLSGLDRAKAHIASAQVRSFFVFAQEWAIGTGRPTWVGYDAEEKQLVAFQARGNNNAYTWRVNLTDPHSRAPLTVDLSALFHEKDLIKSYYDGDFPVLRFTELGTPANSEGKPLSEDVIVPLTEDIGIQIHAGTGLIDVY